MLTKVSEIPTVQSYHIDDFRKKSIKTLKPFSNEQLIRNLKNIFLQEELDEVCSRSFLSARYYLIEDDWRNQKKQLFDGESDQILRNFDDSPERVSTDISQMSDKLAKDYSQLMKLHPVNIIRERLYPPMTDRICNGAVVEWANFDKDGGFPFRL